MSGDDEYLENEWLVVRHSGEMPEVALYSSLYYLTEDTDGPRMQLKERELRDLKRAAMERYQDIVLRDLQPNNRDTSIYRGVKRAIINFQRYQRFCQRQGICFPVEFRADAGEVLLRLLGAEVTEVRAGLRETTINCSFDELLRFAVELGLGPGVLPAGLPAICPGADPTGGLAIV
ncbi:MAG: hypothetical protein ACK5PS_18720 [Desulfopila sp.]